MNKKKTHIVNTKTKEIINIQNVKGKAKPYQVKQFLCLNRKA